MNGSGQADTTGKAAREAVSVAHILRESALDSLDARVLLCHALGWPRSYLITRADEKLAETQPDALRIFLALAARRRAGEPVAQLVGSREFYGRDFRVTPDVLIPRPDTELLVEEALAIIDQHLRLRRADGAPVRVLDLGTGSGAIALTLAAERPTVDIVATDRSTAALDVARANAAAMLGTRRPVRFIEGDWFDALTSAGIAPASFDVIVSNPPYIHRDDAHLSQGDLRFEPRGALTDEADGLNPLRVLTAQAMQWLRPAADAPDATPGEPSGTSQQQPHEGAHASANRMARPTLLVEHGYDQGEAVRGLFRDTGWCDIQTTKDLGGQDRITVGRMPG